MMGNLETPRTYDDMMFLDNIIIRLINVWT